MLTNKTYQTKVMETETEKLTPDEPKPEVRPPSQKPKPEVPALAKQDKALAKRVKALEVIVESAFALREDGTVRKLKRQVKR